MNLTPQRIVRFLIVIGVIASGAGVKFYLDSTRPQPKQKPVTEQGELVVVRSVVLQNHAIHVEAQGRVIPAREIALQTEVSGRIRWLHEELVQGGRVKAGETLVRIDPRDYKLAAEAQRAAVNRSQLELAVEKSRKAVAEREVQLLRGGTASELARREPQLRTAMNALAASESGLELANLRVSKTTLRVSFNAIVLSEAAEAGQLVGPGAPLARLAGTDHFLVQVSVPVSDLGWIAIPGVNTQEKTGALARITQDTGKEQIVREGRVLRLAGDLDPAGQMARLLIEIDDPLGLARSAETRVEGESTLPMLLGAFVDVEIEAGTLEGVVELPRSALRDGGRVFLVNQERQLEVRSVEMVWREEESVYLKQGLKAGDRLILSRLPTAIPGMKLRVQGEEILPPTQDPEGVSDEADKADDAAEARKPPTHIEGKAS